MICLLDDLAKKKYATVIADLRHLQDAVQAVLAPCSIVNLRLLALWDIVFDMKENFIPGTQLVKKLGFFHNPVPLMGLTACPKDASVSLLHANDFLMVDERVRYCSIIDYGIYHVRP